MLNVPNMKCYASEKISQWIDGYLIPFKAKAWMDLTDRRAAGEHVDSKNIKKHKNDVFRKKQI